MDIESVLKITRFDIYWVQPVPCIRRKSPIYSVLKFHFYTLIIAMMNRGSVFPLQRFSICALPVKSSTDYSNLQ